MNAGKHATTRQRKRINTPKKAQKFPFQIADAEESQFTSIIENSTDAIWTLSPEYTITGWNKGAEKMYGYKRKEILGKSPDMIIPEHKRMGFHSNVKRLLQGKTIAKYDSHWITQKGHIIDVSASISPIKDAHGKIIGISLIARNITRQKRMEEALRESEEKFRASFYQTTIAMSLADTSANWMTFNKAYPKMFGYTEKELKKMTPKDLIHPEDVEKSYRAFENLLNGKIKHLIQERRYIHKNGSIIDGVIDGFVVRDESGKAKYVVTVIDNITKRKKAERNLKASEERFRTLIEQSTDVIQLLSAHGKILYTSDSVKRVLGYTPQEIQGQNGTPYLHPDDAPRFYAEFAKLLEQPGNQITVEYRLKHKNGTWLWIEATGINHLDNPAVQAIVGNFRDITQRKLMEKQKDDFLGIASHELKTPVTSLKAFNQLLQRKFMKEGDEQATMLMGKMNTQINKLTSLIEDLLDVNKIENERLQFHMDHFLFDELLDEVIEEIQRTTEFHKIIVSGKTNKKVYADRDRIGQVVTNYLTNAIKYSVQSTRIIVNSRVKDNIIQCSIKDKGIGIPKDDLPKIFDRFYRVQAKTHVTVPGMGLGLNIAAEIIRRHNGKVWAKSTYGKGSTFYFTLPVEKKEYRDSVLLK